MRSEGGLSFKRIAKEYEIDKPKITVVTVVYNGEHEIEETIKSIINQTYKNIEYIIIDGGSSDNTLNIIKSYEDKIDYWVSEADNGIYDAMNKAIDFATCDWVNFMNAGDKFSTHDIIEKVFLENNLNNYDVIYGNNYYKGSNFFREQIANDLNYFYKGMRFNHQSTFIKLDVIKNNKYDLTWKIQCEYDMLLKLFLNNYKFKHVNEFIAIYSDGGFSEQNTIERTIERWLINLRYNVPNVDVNTINHHYLSLLDTNIELFSSVIDEQNNKINRLKIEQESLTNKEKLFYSLTNSIEDICKIQFRKNPLKKIFKYKKMISLYHKIKRT